MATYDLLMLAILVGLTLYGYFKGLAWQVAYVASFVASYFVAVRFADRVAPQITFVNPPANKFVAMLLIYAASSFVVWTIFRVVRRGIDSVKMEGFDHQMGALVGFGRGVLWCVGVTFFAVTLLPAAQKQQIVESRSGYYIARLLDETDSLFPPEVHEVVGPYLDRLETELHARRSGAPEPISWPGASAPAPSWGSPQESSGGRPSTAPPVAPARQPSAADFGWPTSAAPPQSPSQGTPAQTASWPEWP